MDSVIMGKINGHLERIAFDTSSVKQIISQYRNDKVLATNESGCFLEVDGHVYPIKEFSETEEIKPYFVILKSGIAFNVKDYQILFNVEEMPDQFISGSDAAGNRYLCRRYGNGNGAGALTGTGDLKESREVADRGLISPSELTELKDLVKHIRNGEFFEAFTLDFSGRLKDIAQELIDFRKDLHHRIEPDIVQIASQDIPEASNQLEGIIETLENSTMKIMDINEAQMDIANRQRTDLEEWISGNGRGTDLAECSEKGHDILIKIQDILTRLSGEAKELGAFIIPEIDRAMPLFKNGASPAQIMEVLEEPIATIGDLVSDFGDGDKNLAELNQFNEDLRKVLADLQEKEPDEDGGVSDALTPEKATQVLKAHAGELKRIGELSLSMLEPLSFQDLVGQRIQRIIKLVKSMEIRIEELIISFGIRIQKHREDPSRSFEDLDRDVERYKMELKGPQAQGEGLNQNDIDDLLASL
ncbi:MAG: protein phosphatase CheZ [Deltaproteobacteria bacterium]|nr:protein phosphatase CheZ [Deltaproteobacteria bacterium]